MNPILKILATQPLLILDGALATELERGGCDLVDSLWSAKILLENPDKIAEVHRQYYVAGADCVISASYQATFEGFMSRGISEKEAGKLIALSVTLAKEVRDAFWADKKNRSNRPRPLVAASVGPYGAYLADGSEYLGEYQLDEDGLMRFHEKRFQVLVEAGPDVLACETIPTLVEAKALIRLLQNNPAVCAWFCFSAKDGEHISSGEKIEDCARWLDRYHQVAAIGINCTDPQYIESLIEKIKGATDKPIIVYPNGGHHYDPIDKIWHSYSSEDLAYGERSLLWYDTGARIIGGCCKTGPEDIRKIADWVRLLDGRK
ncbi:homocysteine S-methyltransferase [Desulforhopalus sp. 52FAK]